MTNFKLIAGINCGVDKSICQNGYPENCFNCLSKMFNDANFLINIIEVTEQYSKKNKELILYRYIWNKYQDISTIRHIIILTKGGIPALNMNIGDLPIDPILISGFIQANIMFSSKELTMMDKIKSEKQLYEFEYKNFHVLLYNGRLCKICLILNKSASDNLRELLSDFTNIFEDKYEDELKEVEELTEINILKPAEKFIERNFEIYLNYPLILSSTIPPSTIKKLTLVQKAIYECAKDLLKEDDYFFISYVIATTSKLLGVVSDEEILWNIRQMIIEKIIISQEIKFQKQESDLSIKEKEKREDIFLKIKETKDFEEIIFEAHDMSVDDADIKIESFIKKGEISERNAAYQESLNEYQMAYNYANEFNMEMKLKEISLKISKIKQLNKEVELKFAEKQVAKYELKHDYVMTLKYLFQIKDILTTENDGNHDKKMKKINTRIKKIQKNFTKE